MSEYLRLGVNVDHVATLRNARGEDYPCPVEAAKLIELAGGQGITAHLREDRRHIRDSDVERIKKECSLPLNFEMAATEEMLGIALRVMPNAVCLVPEKREEKTTEAGLDLVRLQSSLKPTIDKLLDHGIRVSLFVDPDEAQVRAAKELKASIVEIHTGTYCEKTDEKRAFELAKIQKSAELAYDLGIECHAGHGLTYETTPAIAAIPQMVELNIGHFLIAQSVFTGFVEAVGKMRRIMDDARVT